MDHLYLVLLFDRVVQVGLAHLLLLEAQGGRLLQFDQVNQQVQGCQVDPQGLHHQFFHLCHLSQENLGHQYHLELQGLQVGQYLLVGLVLHSDQAILGVLLILVVLGVLDLHVCLVILEAHYDPVHLLLHALQEVQVLL